MKRITVTIELENAAFEGSRCGFEIQRLLEKVSRDLPGARYQDARRLVGDMTLRDLNGNTVGSVRVSDD